jgi:hypothetical protein
LKPIIVKIMRDLVLLFGILFIVWGLAQVQYGTVQHGVGTDSVPIDTQMATPGSMISVHVKSDNTTETRVVKLESRDAFFQNGTLVDKFLVAGGSDGGGRGRDVNLFSHSPSLTPTAYRIVVLDADGTTDNIANINYTVTYTMWMPDFTLILIGFLMIFMALLFRALSKVQTSQVPVDLGQEPALPQRAPPPMRGPQAPPARAPMQPPVRQPPARAPARAPPPPPPEAYEEPYPPEEDYPPEEAPPPETYEEPEVVAPPPPPVRQPPAAQKPVAKIRCSACGEIIPIFTKNRPIRITCSNCGRSGTLK